MASLNGIVADPVGKDLWSARSSGHWYDRATHHHMNAIDGDFDTYFGTHSVQYNWLEVDFGEHVEGIFAVEVWKRKTLEFRHEFTEVRIGGYRTGDDTGLHRINHNEFCAYFGATQPGQVWFVECEETLGGRYMTLQKDVSGYLDFAEVFVYCLPAGKCHAVCERTLVKKKDLRAPTS